MSPPKSCAVCGDKALGYNFNAVTCESCKAFFRRNALAKKQFTCPFNQNCEITVVTRRFCQKCRLKKCLAIGMKSENIMSEEDKLIKRRKIETNRAKRRLNDKKGSSASVKQEEEEEEEGQQAAADSSGYDAFATSYDSQSCNSFDSGSGGGGKQQASSSSKNKTLLSDAMRDVNPEVMSGEEMVEFIVCDPDRASQAISKLMRTPKEAMASMEKIISSQKDALMLISHLIAYPGDALKIISKLMNSPFNALTVFTKFMSSPTDALEIISKIVSSPQDVLQFIKNLMDSPEDALDIMNKFMNTPAEALKIINKIFNGSNQQTRNESGGTTLSLPAEMEGEMIFQTPITPQSQIHSPETGENTIIHSMLNSSPNNAHQLLLPTAASPRTPLNSAPLTPQTASSYTPSPQAMSIASPIDLATNDLQMQHDDELPSTSAGLVATVTPPVITHAADFDSAHFDIKNFMQESFPNDGSGAGDGLNSLESVLCEVIRIEYQTFNDIDSRNKHDQPHHGHAAMQYTPQSNGFVPCHPNQQPISVSTSLGRELNEVEQMKLRELKLASEALYYPVDDDLSSMMMGDERIKPEEAQDSKLLQVINLTAVAIKRLIKMAKKITAFHDMCQEDQVALLKGGCTEMMIMRSVMTYDGDRNTWKIPHTKETMYNIRAEVLKLAKGNVYEEHLKFISTFDDKWRMDENIILIMMAILLFTPTRTRVIHSDVIRLEQRSYYYLLRRYLESVYPGCEAKSAFIKLIQKISDVEHLNHVIIGVYLNVNPSQVEPLLREIFDLKNH